jgi:hypothetical protein
MDQPKMANATMKVKKSNLKKAQPKTADGSAPLRSSRAARSYREWFAHGMFRK